MRSLRAALCTALVLSGSSWVMPLDGACADAPGHVALVIDLGDEGGDLEYCVAVPDEEITGIDVIELAGDQYGLEYGLGYGGGAVCRLAGVGPEGDDCFASHPDFWGYWRGDGAGGWTWSSSGAGTSSVSAGDTEGWSWGSGMDGSTHQPPPARGFADVCGAVAANERKTESRPRSDVQEPPAASEPPATDPSSHEPRPQARRRAATPRALRVRGRGEDEAVPPPTSHVTETPVAIGGRPVGDRPTGSEATPIGPLAALGATAMLGAGAIAITRRRTRGGQ